MRTVSILPMAYEHLDEVAAIEAQCFSVPWSKNAFSEALASQNYEYIVAVCEKNVVGYAGMQVVLDEAEITNIAVIQAMRGLGIARTLLEALCTLCTRKNVKYLHLEVRESNMPARHLYDKSGFKTDGIRRNFYQKPTENAILMTKFL